MDLAVRGGQPEAATFYLRWHFGRKPIFHRGASARIAGKPAPTTTASNLWESPTASPHNSFIKPVGAGLPAMISLSAIRPAPAPESPTASPPQQLHQTCGSGLARDDIAEVHQTSPCPRIADSRPPQQLHLTCGSGLARDDIAVVHQTSPRHTNRRQPAPHNSCIKPVGAGLPAIKSLWCIRPAPAPESPTASPPQQLHQTCGSGLARDEIAVVHQTSPRHTNRRQPASTTRL